MPRLPHGRTITLDDFRNARDTLTARSADIPLGFAVAEPLTTQDFGFLFPELQQNPANLLPQSSATRNALVELGREMLDENPESDEDADIPAAYTYFGQFVDHDITLEAQSATLPDLVDPDLVPLTPEEIEDNVQNGRTGTLELDSVYGFPAPRDGARMQIGMVSPIGGRPPGKDDFNDLPREGRSSDPERDRAALIGDARNDENTIIAQLHVAFLRAHNELVGQGQRFGRASRTLRQHYQHVVLHDFLKRIVDPQIVDETIQQNRIYDPINQPFMPLEFSVAAYRFGHSMVRAAYNFNLNFNLSGEPDTFPATLELLFTFSALSGQLGDFDTLPDNWIIEWENLVDAGAPFDRTRRIDTKLVEPLFQLTDLRGRPLRGDRAPRGAQPPARLPAAPAHGPGGRPRAPAEALRGARHIRPRTEPDQERRGERGASPGARGCRVPRSHAALVLHPGRSGGPRKRPAPGAGRRHDRRGGPGRIGAAQPELDPACRELGAYPAES